MCVFRAVVRFFLFLLLLLSCESTLYRLLFSVAYLISSPCSSHIYRVRKNRGNSNFVLLKKCLIRWENCKIYYVILKTEKTIYFKATFVNKYRYASCIYYSRAYIPLHHLRFLNGPRGKYLTYN